MSSPIDPKLLVLVEQVIAAGKNKRAIAVLRVLLDKGSISTDEIAELGYEHPPRAVGDARDAGIPIVTGSETSARTGRRMALYTFGNPSEFKRGALLDALPFRKGSRPH